MADVFYLAVGSAAAALVTGLVAGAGTQIASDHRAFIARAWRRAAAVASVWFRYGLTQLAPVLPALAARMPRLHRAAKPHAHKHRLVKGALR